MHFRLSLEERWLSGRKRPPAKWVYGLKPYRGFKSLSLRHFSVRKPLIINKLLIFNDLIRDRPCYSTLLNATQYDSVASTVPLPDAGLPLLRKPSSVTLFSSYSVLIIWRLGQQL